MARAGEFGSVGHLVVRFFGALSPAGPPAGDEDWALGQLLAGEQVLWRRMSGPDRRHAVGVAREVVARLGGSGETPAREVVASALLHDVGKVEAGLGTFARVFATFAALVAGRERVVAAGRGPGERGTGARARLARYLCHDRIGAELLQAAGSAPMTVAWAAEHHLPPERWSVDRRTAEALKAADGD